MYFVAFAIYMPHLGPQCGGAAHPAGAAPACVYVHECTSLYLQIECLILAHDAAVQLIQQVQHLRLCTRLCAKGTLARALALAWPDTVQLIQ